MAAYAVVNSFQGAFGPPTRGHYEGMLLAAQKTLEQYPEGNILMLYMPTCGSSAKPHLLDTMDARIECLNLFCAKLKAEIPAPHNDRIFFEPSTIEYDLYRRTEVLGEAKPDKDTATYWTLKTLKNTYPDSTICLTMGLDNLFDLPFWKNVGTYPTYVTGKIYVLGRAVKPIDAQRTETVEGIAAQSNSGSKPLRFHKYASWHAKYKDGSIVNAPIDGSDLAVKLETLYPILSHIDFVMLATPPPTSSSLLRVALIKYYGEKTQKYASAIKTLTGFDPVPLDADPSEDPWFKTFAIAAKYEKPDDIASFNADFAKAFPSSGGKRSSRRSKRTGRKTYRY